MKTDVVILIAEDDAGHFQLIKKNLWLTCVDSHFIHFKNGQEVLDFLFKTDTEAYSEDKKGYILLLDIRMPQVDGIEVLKRIKEDEELRKIPVIMLTTTSEASMIEQCYELGSPFYASSTESWSVSFAGRHEVAVYQEELHLEYSFDRPSFQTSP
jgi:CheY-like chemotaxis protein